MTTTTLAQYRTRIAARLVDASNAVYSTDTLDEALRSALADYTHVCPLSAETVIACPGAGREIALAGITGLLAVTDVWWPYDSTATAEAWPPNRVRGWRVWWDDAQPVLFLAGFEGAQPQAGDEVRVWHTKAHSIQNLDGGDISTPFEHHIAGLINGAAGYAVLGEALDQAGSVRLDPNEWRVLREWAQDRLKEFREFLAQVRASTPTPGPSFAGGWALDQYDEDYRR